VDRTLFTGQADGPVLMSAFDVFALPSRYEGFPYVLLEAAGRGLPIVTMAVGGAGIVVAEGWNGFIVPQGDDPAPLARKLGTLLSDATLRRVMGQRSVERAAGLTVEKMVERTVAVYREALG
jgi:glycosyltransferase involved in cell wall biosynthesis